MMNVVSCNVNLHFYIGGISYQYNSLLAHIPIQYSDQINNKFEFYENNFSNILFKILCLYFCNISTYILKIVTEVQLVMVTREEQFLEKDDSPKTKIPRKQNSSKMHFKSKEQTFFDTNNENISADRHFQTLFIIYVHIPAKKAFFTQSHPCQYMYLGL